VRCAIEVQNAMVERNAGVPEDRRIAPTSGGLPSVPVATKSSAVHRRECEGFSRFVPKPLTRRTRDIPAHFVFEGSRSTMRFHWVVISAVEFCLAMAPSAQAVEPSQFLTNLMGRKPVAGKTFACYARVYDDAHLASHPTQNIRALQGW
jgi:hypothetical protein